MLYKFLSGLAAKTHAACKVEHAGFVGLAAAETFHVHEVLFALNVMLLLAGGLALLWDLIGDEL